MGNKYVLAMYDIQGKQDFIYKSNKMQQISGASLIIRDCFKEFLIPADIDKSGKILKKPIYNNVNEAFKVEEFEMHIKDGLPEEKKGYAGEVIYEGGGNCYVLYKDIAAYREINKRFYKKLLEETYSLNVITSYIEGVNFDDYQGDLKRLREVHQKRKDSNSFIHPVNALPIVQVSDRDFMPLAFKEDIGVRVVNGKKAKITEKVSHESKKKYDKFHSFQDKYAGAVKENKDGTKGKTKIDSEEKFYGFISGEKFLDDIVTQRGEESLLAVIYIDGNNMRAKLDNCLKGKKTYEECAAGLREFSSEIQTHYIDNRLGEIDTVLEQKQEDKRRFVIYAGDEITFICNARHAYDVACTYLENLYKEDKRTSCAGICIFHSHMPFSDAYRIAEECCTSGKKMMQEKGIANASFLDFHYCQGAIGTSLEWIREHEETTDVSRPWLICSDQADDTLITKEHIDNMKKMLKELDRTNIKDLLFAAKKGTYDFKMELGRILAHQNPKIGDEKIKDKSDVKKDIWKTLKDEEWRKLVYVVYDMAMVYDLWFSETEEVEAND